MIVINCDRCGNRIKEFRGGITDIYPKIIDQMANNAPDDGDIYMLSCLNKDSNTIDSLFLCTECQNNLNAFMHFDHCGHRPETNLEPSLWAYT